MQKQWMAAAKKNKIDFNADLSSAQVQQFESLNKLSGAEFDRAYMAIMVQNHSNNLSRLQSERSASHSTDIRQLIEAALPTIQQHLTLAQQIGSQVGATTTASSGTPTSNPTVPSQQPVQASQAALAADVPFISTVIAADSAEMRMARLAQERTSDAQVRTFAQRMLSEHGEMDREWRALGTRSGQQVFLEVNPRQQQQVARLEALRGAEFDRAYASVMVQNHQENLNTFQNKGRSAQSAEVRQLVNRGLPALQEHLRLAKDLSNNVGGVATTTTPPSNADNGKNGNIKADAEFIRDIDADHFLEIRLARLAESRARNGQVKSYARKMVQEHTDMQKQWTTMAANNGMPIQSGMGKNHKAKLDRLEKFHGADFDREYMALEMQNHDDYLSYFRKEGRAANSAAVRQQVNRGIPILEQHLRQAEEIGGKVGVVGRISSADEQ
jgi:putative membrane protein